LLSIGNRKPEIGRTILKAIARRLTWLEDRFVPRETEESRRIRELLRQARERAAKAAIEAGQPFEELPLLPPTNDGHPWTIGDILVARRGQIRRLEAAQQQ
jgi:hypothetical protein